MSLKDKKVFFSDQIRSMDEYLIKGLNMPSASLMELASASISNIIASYPGKRVLILCGGGNNGGDGYSLARNLSFMGKDVKVYSAIEPSSELCLLNSRLYKEYSDFVDDIDDDFDIIVDSIFGSGFHGRLSSEIKALFDRINSCNALKIAVDIPSGINGNTGEVSPGTFKANITLAIGGLKTGYYSPEAIHLCGDIRFIDIGLFQNRESEWGVLFNKKVFPKRDSFSHKGDSGKVYVIGGSEFYPGAPILSSKAAIASGAGLVYCNIPKKFNETAFSSNEDILFRFRSGGVIDKEEISFINENIDCLICGPGCSDDISKNSWKTLFNALNNKRIVVDADIFKILSPQDLNPSNTYVLTPHLIEFSRFSGFSESSLKKNIFKCIDDFTKKYKDFYLVLKKPGSIVIKDETRIIVPIICDALSKGGSGDVLAGMIGAFIAQCQEMSSLTDIIASAVYIHVRTGKKLSLCRYSGSVTVKQIIDTIGGVIYEEAGKSD